MPSKDNRLLLHICCAGCGAYIAGVLEKEGYKISLFFYNPGIWPLDEYEKRSREAIWLAKKSNQNIIMGNYDHAAWLEKVKGLENEPEKGRRCLICYEDRLRETAKTAAEGNFHLFSSTLSVSPHKLAGEIIKIGKELSAEYGTGFMDRDFKKNDGFKNSSALSKELNLYRQNYCGCEYSLRA